MTSGCAFSDSTGMRFSFPSAKKQSASPFGDQNGDSLAVVFINGHPVSCSIARTQKRSRPSTNAPKTTNRPFGDTRGQLPAVYGGPMVKCVTGGMGAAVCADVHAAKTSDAASTIAAPAAAHGHGRQIDRAVFVSTAGAVPLRTMAAWDPDAAISACSNSPAV